MTKRKPHCDNCDGILDWRDDSWVCRRCGDEWHPSDDPSDDTYVAGSPVEGLRSLLP
jgi:hypothetical protein